MTVKLTQSQLRAANLWRVAEGREDANGVTPTATEQRRAQFVLAESVAVGDFPVQILPAVRATTTAVFDSVETQAGAFTTRKTTQGLEVEEKVKVYSFGDQTNLEGTHHGKEFIPGGLPRIGSREAYPQIGLTATEKAISTHRFGEAFGLDWEVIVNSRGTEVNTIRDAFEAFGEHAKNQEDIDVANLLVKKTGLRTGAGEALNSAQAATTAGGFSVANADLSNPEDFASIAALSNSVKLTVGTSGTTFKQPVNYTRYAILCTPERAPRIKQAMAARRVTRRPGADGGTEWEETLDFGATYTVIGWEWLKRVFPGLGRGWIAVPLVGDRELPVLTSNYLAGYERPQVFVRDSNSRLVGSNGTVDPRVEGDFDSDGVKTKVRHAHGADALWTDGIVYSTGANA